jgi:hypothetical protein
VPTFAAAPSPPRKGQLLTKRQAPIQETSTTAHKTTERWQSNTNGNNNNNNNKTNHLFVVLFWLALHVLRIRGIVRSYTSFVI